MKFLIILTLIFVLNCCAKASILGSCVYKYENQNVYTCTINNVTVVNPTDVLEITGIHLENHTDADVLAVNFDECRINFFNGEVFAKFLNLKQLFILDSDLLVINENAFQSCPNLEELYIALNRNFSTFPPQMLKNCGKLKIFISIIQNTLSVPEDLFGQTSNLEEFMMSSNNLESLPENLLQNMRNLRQFSVSANKLTELNPNLLKNAENLETVDISSNNFQEQEKVTLALNGHTNLTRLNLLSNNFNNFDFQFFQQFQKLDYLTIGGATAPKLTNISWQSLPASLTELRIDNIGENIPENAFDQLSNLISLRISGLDIQSFHKDTFRPLNNLLFMTITDTSIKTLHPDLFVNQLALSDLNLRNNMIEELPAGVFGSLINIGSRSSSQGFKLSSNKIGRLNASSFSYHPQLRYLDFSFNQINEIERGFFNNFNQILSTANFVFNKCVDRIFYDASNLDSDERLLWCFNNWAGITTTKTNPTTTTTQPSPTTTPDGCGRNFGKFEISVIIFVGFLINILQ